MPVLRAFGSARFRLVVAVILISLGALAHIMLFSIAFAYSGTDGNDFNAYRLAAVRVFEGDSPYAASQLTDAIDAVSGGVYLYPPLLAQALAPVARAPEPVVTGAWYVIQFAAMYAAVWLASGLGGARRSIERALWTLAAVLLFMPVLDTLWYGNVSAIVALGATLVAFGGGAAGVAAGLLTLVKVSPFAYVPAVSMMGRRSIVALLATIFGFAGIGIVLAPEAWLEYPAVLANLLAGSTDHGTNVAPATLAARAGLRDLPVAIVRGSSLAVAGLSIGASAWAARHPDGRPVAALLASVAMLLVPGTLWYHYFAVLLPFAAMAWPSAGPRMRAGLLVSAATLSLAIGLEPLALLAATGMVACALPVLWPSRRGIATLVEEHP